MKVSIVVPVHNVAAYIERCVRSVMAQTFAGELECLLVEDPGDDDSFARAERLVAAYAGPVVFRLLRLPESRGVSAARNLGMAEATGDYIYYLDSDDEITPDCIEKLVRPLERDAGIELVLGNYEFVEEGYSLGRKPQALQEEDIPTHEGVVAFTKRSNNVMCWNKLTRRSFLTEHGIAFKEGVLLEDNLWSFYVSQYLSHMYILPEVTYRYCIHPNSMVTGTRKEKLAHDQNLMYEDMAKFINANGDPCHEAGFYVDRILSLLIEQPDIQAYDSSLALFKQGMKARGERTWAMYASLIQGLTRSRAGRRVLPAVFGLIRLVRYRGSRPKVKK